MFGATSIVKNSDKGKWAYSDYGIAFDGKGTWDFGNGFARNSIIFVVVNSSSSQAYNCKDNFFKFYAPEKKFNINFADAKAKFCLSLHYNDDNSCLLFNRREIFEFKTDNGNVNFPTQFCLGRTFKRFFATKSRKVYLKGNVKDFSVDYSAIGKSDI